MHQALCNALRPPVRLSVIMCEPRLGVLHLLPDQRALDAPYLVCLPDGRRAVAVVFSRDPELWRPWMSAMDGPVVDFPWWMCR